MEPRPTYRMLSIRTMALAALAIAAIGAGGATWLLIAYGQGTEADRNQLEAIKTAGTIVLGSSAATQIVVVSHAQPPRRIETAADELGTDVSALELRKDRRPRAPHVPIASAA